MAAAPHPVSSVVSSAWPSGGSAGKKSHPGLPPIAPWTRFIAGKARAQNRVRACRAPVAMSRRASICRAKSAPTVTTAHPIAATGSA